MVQRVMNATWDQRLKLCSWGSENNVPPQTMDHNQTSYFLQKD